MMSDKLFVISGAIKPGIDRMLRRLFVILISPRVVNSPTGGAALELAEGDEKSGFNSRLKQGVLNYGRKN